MLTPETLKSARNKPAFVYRQWLVSCGIAVVIITMAVPRITGPSWRSIVTPMDMREVNGHQVHWESIVVLRSVHTATAQMPLREVISGFNTDEYRALMPIYFAAIGTVLTGSYFWGETIAELFWWWLGSVCTVALARRQRCSWLVSTIAGILTAASPLGVAHIGALGFHTASSMALPVATLIAWDALHTESRSTYVTMVRVGFAIFVSSITYTYQWVLIPWLLGLGLVSQRPKAWLLTVVGGIAAFAAISGLAKAVLQSGGLVARPHLNDPVAVIVDRIRPILEANIQQIYELLLFSIIYLFEAFINIILFFHPIIAFFTLLGAVNGSKLRNSWLLLAIIISILQSSIYGLAWISMTCFPLVYISSAQGLKHFLSYVFYIFSFLHFSFLESIYIRLLLLFFVIISVIIATNADLFGYDQFVIRWWGSWYVPH